MIIDYTIIIIVATARFNYNNFVSIRAHALKSSTDHVIDDCAALSISSRRFRLIYNP